MLKIYLHENNNTKHTKIHTTTTKKTIEKKNKCFYVNL